MAKKRKAFVHIGLPGTGDVIEGALARHRHALAALGVKAPAASSEEMFRAAIEIRRDHQAWGYRRREVEGTWSHICRRAQKGKDPVVVSQPLLGAAAQPQVDLLVDGLAGFAVHVVVTVSAPDAWTVSGDAASDLGVVLERWSRAVRKPGRLHVIVLPHNAGREAAWKAFGKLVGFGTASLSVSDLPPPLASRPPTALPSERVEVLRTLSQSWVDHLAASEYDVRGDLADLTPASAATSGDPLRLAEVDHALMDALREVERLSRRNDSLELRVGELARKRTKLKRRLDEPDDAEVA